MVGHDYGHVGTSFKHLFTNTYQPRFTGHETFPLRYGWLKKVFDRVDSVEYADEGLEDVKHLYDSGQELCFGEGAVARFGVGKNMVKSMRHWALALKIIHEPTRDSVKTTKFGRMIFSLKGLDPYMENPSTLWLIHWKLASSIRNTTWFWVFNFCPRTVFKRNTIVTRLSELAKFYKWPRAKTTTIQRDVSCFIRTYSNITHNNPEDTYWSPLAELGLIKAVGSKNTEFILVRERKEGLGDGVFIYALCDYWRRAHSQNRTLSLETITDGPGSPGCVFLLDESAIIQRLSRLEDITNGYLRFSETSGLKQVIRKIDIDDDECNIRSIVRDYTVERAELPSE